MFENEIRQKHLEADIKYIFDERNTLAHTGDIEISAEEFGKRWPKISQNVLNVSRVLEDEDIETIESLIADLTEGNYDAVASLKSVNEIADLQHSLKELNDQLKKAIEGEWDIKEFEYLRKKLQNTVNKDLELLSQQKINCRFWRQSDISVDLNYT